MHNIAIALHLKGHMVTGSDDDIFEPSKSRLALHGLLPEVPGWHPEKISNQTDAVILGMHARKDNPELLRAQELGIRIYSFPEFLYEQTRNKKRVVIGGSHGKTTITSMIMHVLKESGIKFDYLVGSLVEGFETMAGLEDDSEIAVFEGDEYLSSPVDPRPKFHLYHPDIAVISGIAWDHMNVFPTFDIYCEQFKKFTSLIEPDGILIYFEEDKNLKIIADEVRKDIRKITYTIHRHIVENSITFLIADGKRYQVRVFGRHNMQNISAAHKVCSVLGISGNDFYKSISSFRGAQKRLQLLFQSEKCAVFLDFAHSPSKLRATVEAVKQQFTLRKLLACIELHTFSSMTMEFLHEYKYSMAMADKKVVYFDPETARNKKLEVPDADFIKSAFGDDQIMVFNNKEEFSSFLLSGDWNGYTILFMSSGTFSNMNFQEFIDSVR